MTRTGTVTFLIIALAVPAGLIAEDTKETPERTIEKHDSKTMGAVQVRGEGLNWFPLSGKTRLVAPNSNAPGLDQSTALFPGTDAVEVNVDLRKTIRLTEKAKVEAGKGTVVN